MNRPKLLTRRGLPAAAACLLSGVAVVGLSGAPAAGVPGAATGGSHRAAHAVLAAPVQAHGADVVTKRKTVERYYIDNGKKTVVDKRTVTVKVSETQNLRSLQQIGVSWSGAKPTQGVALDPNSQDAATEEYSFALFECRGVDSTSVPAKDRLSPETCWTQAAPERYQGGTTPDPAWQFDAEEPAADRQPIVNQPADALSIPKCKQDLYGVAHQRWLSFVAADGTTYEGGPDGCAGLPPEAVSVSASDLSLPSNETFGVTDAKGQGSTNFDVFTAADHASLGCSSTVPCSLVAVPIEGIDCDPEGSRLPAAMRPSQSDAETAAKNCETTGNLTPGEIIGPSLPVRGAQAVDGLLWWSASNWKNRISIPLTFAPSSAACSVTSPLPSLSIFGTELLSDAVSQWAPEWCEQSKLFNTNVVQSSEPQARELIGSGGAEAAATTFTGTGQYPKPVVNAPVAVSGFAVGFTIDNAQTHQVITHLNLDARLLAKLLTESYPAESVVEQNYPAIASNPENMFADPEFQALNPGVGTSHADEAAALLILDIRSDVVTALTSYINSDPEARAWLDGKPDPWGMTVNPSYKGIALPVDSWPLLDSWEPTSYYASGANPCLKLNPQPYLPLIQHPQGSLYQNALDTSFAIGQSETNCSQTLLSQSGGSPIGDKLVVDGRQPPGYRAMLSVVSLPDAAHFALRTAALETYTAPSAPAKFTNAAGRSFAEPDTAALRAAAGALVDNPKQGVYTLDYAKLRSKQFAGAYPGLMPIYMTVPLTGLPKADAAHYATVVKYAAGPGQVPGPKNGQLPAGYLPMTASNGLGGLAEYAKRAAAAISVQRGTIPSLHPGHSPKPVVKSPPTGTRSAGEKSPGVVTGGGSSAAAGAGSAVSAAGGNSGGGGTSPDANGKPSTTSPQTSPEAKSLGPTPLTPGGPGSWALPVLLIVLLLSGGGAAALRLQPGRRR